MTSFKSLLAGSARLRALVFPLFARFNLGDITVRHHYTGDVVTLHSFRHRGYWWHGRDRERETMAVFRALVRPGDTVFDVGSHIGYTSLYFAHLVGASGRVHAFEPGANNLPYTRANLNRHRNVTVVEKAVGPAAGTSWFYLEDLTGQNNSMLKDYRGIRASSKNAVKARVRAVEVEVLALDDYAGALGATPDFMKVDVEGFELGVLRGATALIEAHHPMMMVETSAESARAMLSLLGSLGYSAFRPDGTPVRRLGEQVENSFYLHPTHHAESLRRLGWKAPPDAP